LDVHLQARGLRQGGLRALIEEKQRRLLAPRGGADGEPQGEGGFAGRAIEAVPPDGAGFKKAKPEIPVLFKELRRGGSGRSSAVLSVRGEPAVLDASGPWQR